MDREERGGGERRGEEEEERGIEEGNSEERVSRSRGEEVVIARGVENGEGG